MKKSYLSAQGLERALSTGENSHADIACAVLGPAWTGTDEDACAAMWHQGWVRIAEGPVRLYAESYKQGRPTKWSALTVEQRDWLRRKEKAGLVILWNGESLHRVERMPF